MNIEGQEIIEFIDLLNYTFSNRFVDKWKYKYSTSFIKKFQFKVLKSMNDKKPVKQKTLYTYMTKKCRYSEEQVDEFFNDIDIEIYYPLVM
jgi:hypothetical protein